MAASFVTARNLTDRGFRHAFFTREGGHSPPPFDSLHFGGTGHSSEALEANVRAAALALGVEPGRLFTVTQVHGGAVIELDGSEDRRNVHGARADALLSPTAGVACGVKVADCLPLLLADARSGAVAAVHSGWQSAVANVSGAAILAMRAAVGGAAEIVAAIGPHIGACCFEVGDDVAERLAEAAGTDAVVERRHGRAYVDLTAVVVRQLSSAGIAADAIEVVGGCAKCDATRFFSYRRDGEQSGRNLAAIVARARAER